MKKPGLAIILGSPAKEELEGSSDPELAKDLAADVLSAIKSGKASSLADALHAFFKYCDAMPHEEGEHEEEEY